MLARFEIERPCAAPLDDESKDRGLEMVNAEVRDRVDVRASEVHPRGLLDGRDSSRIADVTTADDYRHRNRRAVGEVGRGRNGLGARNVAPGEERGRCERDRARVNRTHGCSVSTNAREEYFGRRAGYRVAQ